MLSPKLIVFGLLLNVLRPPRTSAYDFVKWDVEPVIDFTEDPELARTVYFIHMRKAAGTAVRQFFRTIYHRKSCLPLKERKLVHSDQDNWRCNHLAFFHVEWHCFMGSEIAGLRRRALLGSVGSASQLAPAGGSGTGSGGLTRDSLLTHFYPMRQARFVTCLRHPIDRLISITWYGESSHGMQYMKYLHQSKTIGFDSDGNDLSIRPEGDHKRTWYRNSIDIAKTKAAQNATLWNEWVRTVEQSTIWNYYVTRLAGNSCHRKEKACTLATRCLALGPQGGFGEAEEGEDPKSIDPEHPYGCDALFTNDYSFPKPKFNTKRTSDPDTFGEEVPTPPGVPSPMARWVNNALTGPCAKHSHKVTTYTNKTRRDLEDAKDVLTMFDAVLVSERLGEPGVMLVMESVFGAAAKGMEFPNANRGLFTHDLETKMRAGWRKAVPEESLKLMLHLNALDIRLYWFADKLLDARISKLQGTAAA